MDEALQAKIERELQMQRSPQDVQNSFKTLLARWKALPKHKRVKGKAPLLFVPSPVHLEDLNGCNH